MPVTAALPKEEGLSADEAKVATALIHCRLRGLFSDISYEFTSTGGTILVVWGIRITDKPQFRISRWGGDYVCNDYVSGKAFETDCLVTALDLLRAQYPQITAL